MSLFSSNNYWKFVLMVLGAAILAATIIYSNFLAEKLKKNEEKNIILYTEAIKGLIKLNDQETYDENYWEFINTVKDSFPLPVIYEDENGELEGLNFKKENLNNQEFLLKKRDEFLASGEVPISGKGYAKYIYCFNSPLLTYIKLFPVIQGLLVGLYIALGYFIFNSSRKAEQNRVWAGMAKETAHQLGTPISAILGWVEYLKDNYADQPDQLDVLNELTKDVDRLELVADRFSKIGSEPVLKPADIFIELYEVKEYLQRRASRKIVFNFKAPDAEIFAMINKHLFAWVIENLIRNSLDAMDGKGTISCKVFKQNNYVCIELSDTGHGIPSHKFKSVFRPGYSTKKRGWGLGLSLAKRIIEEYHKGKIYVKSSKPNEETTFAIILPLAG
ncbi:MAG: HAMP domain-containing histidine kinase [Saprospiraceae bacterium]|jgi:signal transduction histidine kinase|nr:HAMP domain-containing histidine kinase [Saprospiraceae bacterium]MBP6565756.1 HAMP domain-containing histidine kinase [Saprospiraceae bacterium]